MEGLRAAARKTNGRRLLRGALCYGRSQSGFPPFGGVTLQFTALYTGVTFSAGSCGRRRRELIAQMGVRPEEGTTTGWVAVFSIKSAYRHLPDVHHPHSDDGFVLSHADGCTLDSIGTFLHRSQRGRSYQHPQSHGLAKAVSGAPGEKQKVSGLQELDGDLQWEKGVHLGNRHSTARDPGSNKERVILLRVKQLFKNTAVTPTPVTGTAATPTPATGTAAEPENQPVLVSVAPVHKKKSWKRKSAHLESDEEASPKREQEEAAYCPGSEEADYSKAGPSRVQEEEEEEFPASPRGRTQQVGSFSSSEGEEELINEMVTTQSLSLSEL
ncbi:hypothetical protein QYF61_005752 [Mycteria americana]|uniref:Uncharacterized protein n=1 Tax=Mycteria americana TaxID=33587 RepID=A0AAN7S5P8_MYCAM|nr:hypothetical protein QYF61_005752 [Mycteria americana]